MNVVVHRLKRVVEIWKVLNQQVDVLETMTPLDFLDFRSSLEGASGFQSTQFRQIEATLGLRMENRFRPDYYKHTEMGGFNEADFADITEAEQSLSLLKLVEQWLARMPFFADVVLDRMGAKQLANGNEAGCQSSGADTESSTRTVFRTAMKRPICSASSMRCSSKPARAIFHRRRLRAALFIMLYRDEPLFRLPFALLNSLIEIDEQLGNFRYRHLQMVRRMIGTRIGTGGSSGEQYLQGAVNKNYIYKELAGVITFLIERRNLPQLSKQLHRALRFSSAER